MGVCSWSCGCVAAIHTNRPTNTNQTQQKQVYETVEALKSDYPSLRLGHGKCVYELRPDITWDKGKVRVLCGWMGV